MRGRIRLDEFDGSRACALAGKRQHRSGNVYAHDPSIATRRVGIGQCRGGATAADVENVLAGFDTHEALERRADRQQGFVETFLRLGPALARGTVPIIDLILIGAHFFIFLLRMASVRRRSAFSLMKPCASFWS